ncbi:hypothetical protein L6164_004374 [Bauhinia variegata]|uniref:Uncharacterized protein n=1 Tax=Bauhinia variegata TaxID=167791 RepID=A0ACB9Q4W0_BAUVA|nr:hypothetical protein L6164_004374 [Bauhinia variegata]
MRYEGGDFSSLNCQYCITGNLCVPESIRFNRPSGVEVSEEKVKGKPNRGGNVKARRIANLIVDILYTHICVNLFQSSNVHLGGDKNNIKIILIHLRIHA